MKKHNLSSFLLLIVMAFSWTTSLYAVEEEHPCPSGMFWDSQVNRCMISQSNAAAKKEAIACDGLTGDEFKKCFQDNANNQVTTLEEDGDMQTHTQSFSKGDGAKIAVPLAISLITSYYLFLNKEKFEGCKNTSLWLLFGGGVASFIGEVSAQMTYKSKTKNLADEYQKKMEDYEDTSKYSIMTKNQTIAFDYLIAAEEARISAEKIRKGAYTLAETLYAATVAMALVESAQVGLEFGGGCGSSSETVRPGNNSSPSTNTTFYSQEKYKTLTLFAPEFSGYEYITNMTVSEFFETVARKVYANIIPSAYANTIDKCAGSPNMVWDDTVKTCVLDKDVIVIGNDKCDENSYYDDSKSNSVGGHCFCNSGYTLDTEAFKCVKDKTPDNNPKDIKKFVEKNYSKVIHSDASDKQMGFVDKAIATPYIRAALATALGLYANQLREDAAENIKISENRIELLKKIRDDFVASGGAGGFTLCDEADYDDQQKPHCFCYTKDGEFDPQKEKLSICSQYRKDFELGKIKQYGWKYGQMNDAKVCVDEKNQLDTFCKCKSQKSSTGKGNACTKISNKLNLSGFGGATWVNGLANTADSLLTGQLSGGQLDSSDLNKKALKIRKNIEKLAKKSKYRDTYKKAQDTSLKLQNANKAWIKKSFGNNIPRSLASSSLGSSSALPTSAKEIMKTAAKTAAKHKNVTYKDNGALSQNKTNGKKDLDFDWGTDSAKGGVKIEDVAAVMDKNYAYKGDINTNPANNIFQILSNRYQRSGLRRLFDADGKADADEANESDINGN